MRFTCYKANDTVMRYTLEKNVMAVVNESYSCEIGLEVVICLLLPEFLN